MVKKLIFPLMVLWVIGLTGCGGGANEELSSIPELSPVCPEGWYWIDSIKSCEILEDNFDL